MTSSKIAGAALAAFLMALVGCTLTNPGLRKDKDQDGPVQLGGGERIIPKRCALRVMVASRPINDAALGEGVWRVADEQAIEADARRALQANGLRIGLASGDLPTEVQAVLDAPPPKQILTQTVILPDGDSTLIDTGTESTSNLSLILGQKDKVVGKVYQDARAFLRVGASFDGADGVSLRVTPELHHGPMQQGWSVAGGATPMTPGQIIPKHGQKEESFRDMACTLTLKPGQVAVIGGRHEKRGSLGDFLFGDVEPDSDRQVQKVVFVWATRSGSDDVDGKAPPAGLVPIDPMADVKGGK